MSENTHGKKRGTNLPVKIDFQDFDFEQKQVISSRRCMRLVLRTLNSDNSFAPCSESDSLTERCTTKHRFSLVFWPSERIVPSFRKLTVHNRIVPAPFRAKPSPCLGTRERTQNLFILPWSSRKDETKRTEGVFFGGQLLLSDPEQKQRTREM
jgi:hypothetical protein